MPLSIKSNEIFFKKYLLVEKIFQQQLIAEASIRVFEFLVKPVLKIP